LEDPTDIKNNKKLN